MNSDILEKCILRKKGILYDTLTNKSILSWVGNFAGNHRKFTQVIKECQMSTSLSKIWITSLTIKRVIQLHVSKKVILLWVFIKKTSEN